MNTHLSPEEFVDALDGALDARRRGHLETCEACREDLEAARAAMGAVREVGAPEPSPLFWDHFSARVTQATAETRVPKDAWWNVGWRPAGAMFGALGALALVMVLRPPVAPETRSGGAGVPGVEAIAAADGAWDLVMGMAAELEWSDVREATEPAEGAADAMIEALTPAQRDALVRLLHNEIGGW